MKIGKNYSRDEGTLKGAVNLVLYIIFAMSLPQEN